MIRKPAEWRAVGQLRGLAWAARHNEDVRKRAAISAKKTMTKRERLEKHAAAMRSQNEKNIAARERGRQKLELARAERARRRAAA